MSIGRVLRRHSAFAHLAEHGHEDDPVIKAVTSDAEAAEARGAAYLKPALHELWEGRDQARSPVARPIPTYLPSRLDRAHLSPARR
ncbi:MAG: hypothetical protein ACJ789_05150 [Thermomicrobiales bacterium]